MTGSPLSMGAHFAELEQPAAAETIPMEQCALRDIVNRLDAKTRGDRARQVVARRTDGSAFGRIGERCHVPDPHYYR